MGASTLKMDWQEKAINAFKDDLAAEKADRMKLAARYLSDTLSNVFGEPIQVLSTELFLLCGYRQSEIYAYTIPGLATINGDAVSVCFYRSMLRIVYQRDESPLTLLPGYRLEYFGEFLSTGWVDDYPVYPNTKNLLTYAQQLENLIRDIARGEE